MERQPTRKIELSKGSPFVAMCLTEKQILYEPTEDNSITRTVGEQAALDHARSFNPPHQVAIVELKINKPL